MDKIVIDKIGVPSPWDRIRDARVRIMDIEKRVNVVILQIMEKEGRLKYDISLDADSKIECKKDGVCLCILMHYFEIYNLSRVSFCL